MTFLTTQTSEGMDGSLGGSMAWAKSLLAAKSAPAPTPTPIPASIEASPAPQLAPVMSHSVSIVPTTPNVDTMITAAATAPLAAVPLAAKIDAAKQPVPKIVFVIGGIVLLVLIVFFMRR